MPRKSDSIPINDKKLDRRIKLTDAERVEIFQNKDNLSQRALARQYGVSRRTIVFILDPSKLEANKQRRKERGGWQQYYNKEEHREATKEHREYKKELYKNGLIKPKTNENEG